MDDPQSRVDIAATAAADLKGIGRLLRSFANGVIPVNAIAAQLSPSGLSAAPGSLLRQAVRFGAVGVVSSAAYVALFMMMQGSLGAQVANLIALLLTAIGNTAANRRFTFGVGGRANATRHHVEGLLVFGIALAITSRTPPPRRRTAPPDRTHRAGAGQPGGHRSEVRPPAGMGVSPAPSPLTVL